MNNEQDDRLHTEPETAVQLGVSLWTMIKWRKQGRIKAIRLGHRTLRYKASDIAAFIRKNTTKAN